jgi:hypothetical protein
VLRRSFYRRVLDFDFGEAAVDDWADVADKGSFARAGYEQVVVFCVGAPCFQVVAMARFTDLLRGTSRSGFLP